MRGVHSDSSRQGRLLQWVGPWLLSAGLHLLVVLVACLAIWRGGSDPAVQPVAVQLGESSASRPLLFAAQRVGGNSTSSEPSTDPNPGAGVSLTPQLSRQSQAMPGHVESAGSGDVVWIVLASGRLLGVMDLVVMDLKQAILSLHDTQRFGLLFVTQPAASEGTTATDRVHAAGGMMSFGGLLTADAAGRQQAVHWLDDALGRDMVPGYAPSLVSALTAAHQFDVPIVHLVMDGHRRTGRDAVDVATVREQADALTRRGVQVLVHQWDQHGHVRQMRLNDWLVMHAGRSVRSNPSEWGGP